MVFWVENILLFQEHLAHPQFTEQSNKKVIILETKYRSPILSLV